jgi:glycosyltransferase involved in cell wall biosynthesis
MTASSLVSTINSWYENEHGGSIKGFIYGKLELLTNKNLDLYITVSQQDRQSLLRSNIAEDQIELIYNAVDLDPRMVREDSEEIRKKYGLSQDSVVCTAVGRLVPVKGYDILVDAIGLMAGRIPGLVCLIVGEGECRDSLKNQIADYGLQECVRLIGFQDRSTILSILKASDIFVMPSRYEGTPVALLEAAGMACPILASSIGGIPELVKSGEHALLVPPENSIALADGLEKLYKDRDYARQLGKNAQRRIFENFDLKTQGSATWNAYRKAWTKHNTSA